MLVSTPNSKSFSHISCQSLSFDLSHGKIDTNFYLSFGATNVQALHEVMGLSRDRGAAPTNICVFNCSSIYSIYSPLRKRGLLRGLWALGLPTSGQGKTSKLKTKNNTNGQTFPLAHGWSMCLAVIVIPVCLLGMPPPERFCWLDGWNQVHESIIGPA